LIEESKRERGIPVPLGIVRKALRHPWMALLSAAARYSYRGPPERAILETVAELERASALDGALTNLENPADLIPFCQRRFPYHTAYLYGLCRLLKPEAVVETGVYFGASSAFILHALAQNGKGHLYSIDLPRASGAFRVADPKGGAGAKGTGFTVPQGLRGRWTLVVGDARSELPPLLARVGAIDLFHHDSVHTYDQMTFELERAFDSLKGGGMVVCDDVLWNSAFPDFAARHKLAGQVASGVGFLRKPGLPKTSSPIPAVAD
jgi:predicted O-methyltransferase YrrM